jgi:hypothetical protein
MVHLWDGSPLMPVRVVDGFGSRRVVNVKLKDNQSSGTNVK